MRILFICLVLYSALLLFSGLASAQEGEKAASPVVNSWLVGSAASKDGAKTGECMMTAVYGNGLNITFKSTGHDLTALHIKDASNKIADQVQGFIGFGLAGDSYALPATVDGVQVSASLKGVPDVADSLMDLDRFRLRLGEEDYYFSTLKFVKGYGDLLACSNGTKTTRTVPKSLSVPAQKTPAIEIKDVKADEMPETPVYMFKGRTIEVLNKKDNQAAQSIDEAVAKTPRLLPMEEDGLETVNKMPLIMALPMVVPTTYSYQLDHTVNGMAPVAVSGSGNWKSNLRQAVDEYDYNVAVNEKVVYLSRNELPEDDASVPEITWSEDKDANKQIERTYHEPIKEGHKWTAARGERLSVVLARWAKEAGVNTQINLGHDPVLPRDFIAVSAFGPAVNGLLGDVMPEGVATLNFGADKVAPVSSPKPGKARSSSAAVAVSPAMPDQNATMPLGDDVYWRALQGTDLRNVLERWTVKEGMDFVWETDRIFYIPQSLKVTTDYAQAVSLLLTQFSNHPVQPKAVLNTDPQTGRKALIVKTVNAEDLQK